MLLLRKDMVSSFFMGTSSFPVPFVEKTVLFPWYGLSNPIENHLTVCARVYFWALETVPLVSVCTPASHCSDSSRWLSSEIRTCVLQLCSSFSESFLSVESHLNLHMNFRIDLSISTNQSFVF